MKQNDTKIQILDAAIELFWSKSYHGVNMNELSRAAGVNKATVYQHFGSKEAVALAAIRRATERTEAYLYHSTFEDVDDPKEQIEQIYQKAYEIQEALQRENGNCRGCPFVNIGVELATSNDAIRKEVAKTFALFRGHYRRIIERHWALGGRQEGRDASEIAAALLNNMNGSLVAAKLENRPEALLDGEKQALSILAH